MLSTSTIPLGVISLSVIGLAKGLCTLGFVMSARLRGAEAAWRPRGWVGWTSPHTRKGNILVLSITTTTTVASVGGESTTSCCPHAKPVCATLTRHLFVRARVHKIVFFRLSFGMLCCRKASQGAVEQPCTEQPQNNHKASPRRVITASKSTQTAGRAPRVGVRANETRARWAPRSSVIDPIEV